MGPPRTHHNPLGAGSSIGIGLRRRCRDHGGPWPDQTLWHGGRSSGATSGAVILQRQLHVDSFRVSDDRRGHSTGSRTDSLCRLASPMAGGTLITATGAVFGDKAVDRGSEREGSVLDGV